MTPKEKAKELVDKFQFILTKKQFGKECALIAVDEVLLACALETKGKFEYYLEVKQEIEKL